MPHQDLAADCISQRGGHVQRAPSRMINVIDIGIPLFETVVEKVAPVVGRQMVQDSLARVIDLELQILVPARLQESDA